MTNTFDTLKNQIDLRDIVRQVWGKPARFTPSRDHHFSHWRDDGRNPDFTVSEQHYKDFATGEHGDVFDFLEREGVVANKREALEWVRRYLGDPTTPRTSPRAKPTPSTSPNEPPNAEWQQVASATVQQAQDYLWSAAGAQVLAYLRHKRGLSDETIKHFGLGYNPRWRKLNHKIDGKPISLPPGITIPVYLDGALWALKVRCVVDKFAAWLNVAPHTFTYGKSAGTELPKYMNLQGGTNGDVLFNGDAIPSEQPIIMTEGEFDAMLAQQILGIPAITLGSASNQSSTRSRAHLDQASTVYLVLDNDKAGQKAQANLLQMLGDKAQHLTLPVGKDITDYVVEHGGDLQTWFQDAVASGHRFYRDGLPDSWRRALLAYGPPSGALIAELLWHAVKVKHIQRDSFTVKDLNAASEALNYNISYDTLRLTLKHLEGLFIYQLDLVNKRGKGRPSRFYALLSTDAIKANLKAWADPRIREKHHKTKGRDATVSQHTSKMLQDMGYSESVARMYADDLNNWLKPAYRKQGNREQFTDRITQREQSQLATSLDDLISTPLLEGWPRHNASTYRELLIRSFVVQAAGTPISTREMAASIGVNRTTVPSIKKRAGIASEEQFADPVEVPEDGDLHTFIKRQSYAHRGYARTVTIVDEDGVVATRMPTEINNLEDKVRAFQADGFQVLINIQTASTHHIVANIRQTQAKRTYSARPILSRTTTSRRRFYGPQHDPEWLTGQLKLALMLMEVAIPASVDQDNYPELLQLIITEKLRDQLPPAATV